ncbi:MAG TPA: ATP-binding protein, partial [Solirubrobacteraceae bacterium]|nr:ATP-binding protein [Solirubrobacteraceae bacterium]
RRPASAHLALRCQLGGVELEVTDTGRPADAGGTPQPFADGRRSSSGRGLRGMRERAAAYGGSLDAGPGPDGGWRVRLSLTADAESAAR